MQYQTYLTFYDAIINVEQQYFMMKWPLSDINSITNLGVELIIATHNKET
jgi:hypothetical protein